MVMSLDVPVMLMPLMAFPEMTFRAPATLPPMVMFVALSSQMPSLPLPRSTVPPASRPMMFPWITWPEPRTQTPVSLLPETTFPAPAAVLPIVVFALAADSTMPSSPFSSAVPPVASTPT